MPLSNKNRYSADVAILGSGFAGSVLALVLDKIGLKTVVIDKATHPRFTIGESSTPIGNMILRELAEKYHLPQLLPLTNYGDWRKAYPHLVNGRKRGFSYFQHIRGEVFKPTSDHSNELLVTASADNNRCDTHWLRADIDNFLVQEVKQANVPVFENTQIQTISEVSHAGSSAGVDSRWRVDALQNEQPVVLDVRFLIDASGPAGVLAHFLNLADHSTQLHTRSHALFSHFEDLPTWHKVSAALGVRTEEHPYFCDDAAVHQCIQHGWMWMLRFVNGRVSAGFVLDSNHYPINYSIAPERVWDTLLCEYPTLQNLFKNARLADIPGKLYRTGRLQRLWGPAAGANWALLPGTTGFIDPLHSTGIAHALSGVERLAQLLAVHWESDGLGAQLERYSDAVVREIKLVDHLVAGCYPGLGMFDVFATYTMLYFATAITYEERRLASYKAGSPFTHDFLCADEKPLVDIIKRMFLRLKKLTSNEPSSSEIQLFREEVKSAIQPYNTAGLFTPRVNNMYEYTAADVFADSLLR